MKGFIAGFEQKKLTRRRILWLGGAGFSTLLLSSVYSSPILARTTKKSQILSTVDILAIQDLSTRYFYVLDGLDKLIVGDPATNWANTFTPDGTFSIVQTNGEVLLKATGFDDLIRTYKTFPDIQTTRHWINDLVIEPDVAGAKSGCYIIAMNIKNNPATIIRSGIYQDRLVKIRDRWKFKSRTLILDPNSPAG
ncbi:nuclear transport factor 2 family protein [Merismopedia glauca]|uniref:SnoaL-like domain-containing protein n=1 Tax=Merismopedia glauca CCAP 1448/3 TaxID=1296344 RepID=A0A2T1C4J8_9CYAN|nr:nuclear transport factor 2 family protein [Merismopedia glauca]PSB03205.1 hypothetical protein C7B64_09655 [Merismopedia glauca CCAP 1448/3]